MTAPGHEGHGVHLPAQDTRHPIERERPEDWGWHHEWKRSTPIIGWVMTIAMVLLVFGNHQGNIENLWLLGLAALMAFALIRMHINRRNAWRA